LIKNLCINDTRLTAFSPLYNKLILSTLNQQHFGHRRLIRPFVRHSIGGARDISSNYGRRRPQHSLGEVTEAFNPSLSADSRTTHRACFGMVRSAAGFSEIGAPTIAQLVLALIDKTRRAVNAF
jgi:hypothetical protein